MNVERVLDVADDAGSRMVQFGTNEWLVDEIYQQYLKDPQSVDRAWWDFFADYRPGEPSTIPSPASSAGPAGGGAAPGPAMGGPLAVVDAPRPGPSAPSEGQPKADVDQVGGPALAHNVPAYEVEAPSSPVGQVAPQVGLSSIPTGEDAEGTEAAPRILRGPAARVVVNMEASLDVPTATSVRSMPGKLLIDNRQIINNQLTRGRGGKVSFTHLIGYALVRALADMPDMNVGFTTVDGKPAVASHQSINLGLAIDLTKPDGTRQLLVPCIKGAHKMDFAAFWATYEELVRKARAGGLTADDFAGTTVTLTNPGTIGTVHSVPRLMSGQGLIVGVGSLEYPAEWQGSAPETLARSGVS